MNNSLNTNTVLVKTAVFVLLLFFVGISGFSQPVRSKLNFNNGWKFKLGDYKGAEAITYDDAKWETIGLPHSFSIPYFMSSDFYTGYGWYRKNFEIPAAYKEKRLFMEFEGAFQDAEIFVNGKKAGAHKGGYTGFNIDITKLTKTGSNVLAVRLNNMWNPCLAPRAGEHTFSGGIYRDVYLVVTNPVHVDWYGTFVTTPSVSVSQATVNVKTEIRNDDTKTRQIKLVTKIFNSKGKLISSVSTVKNIASQATFTFDQTTPAISNPELWHPTHPFMYRAVTNLFEGNKLLDDYETPFGIRWLKFTADKGFFINDEHCYLKGANVHQDHAGWGDAVTNAGFYRDVKLVKDAGFNFIRGSHYPHDLSFADACDEQGMLFWSENAFWGIGGFSRNPEGYWNSSAYPTIAADRPEFDASVLTQLEEMIRISRNHPSIFVWSMSNEPFFSSPEAIAPMRELLKKSVALSHKLDPTRAAAIGGAQRPLNETRIDLLGDVAGYNGDGASISVFQNPGIPTVISEYGSTTADRPGNYEPGWGDLEKDKGEGVHPWRSGQAIWCAFDHGSIAGAQLGKMGIIDYFRIPKQSWYWYRNFYRNIPPPVSPVSGTPVRLSLEADKVLAKTNGTDDIILLVKVLDKDGNLISNNPPVELSIVSGPGEFPTGSSIKFEEKSDIRILDGQAAIEFRSYFAGETIIRATSPGLQPAEVKLRFEGPFAFKPGLSLQVKKRDYIRFSKKGQPNIPQVFGKDNPTFSSSSIPINPAGYAADGNKKTFWKASENDPNPSWTLDTEKGVSISDIKISFPEENIYQYKIEVSENRQAWKFAADFMQNSKRESVKQISLSGITGRFLRISFRNASIAGIAEVEVVGKILE